MTKITKPQQVKNIIEWIDRLKNFKKTTGLLGAKSSDGWSYCCLGVACRINRLPGVDFEDAKDDRLIERLCLRNGLGYFYSDIIMDFGQGSSQFRINSLARANDRPFGLDANFTRQRAFMIMTIDRWVADPWVAVRVNSHFKKELKSLKVDFRLDQ